MTLKTKSKPIRPTNNIEDIFKEIINENSVTYKSIRKWMYYPALIDDATAELVSYLYNKFKDNPDELLTIFNREKRWITYIGWYCNNQLMNNKSIFFRRYNSSYKFDDLSHPTIHNDDNIANYVDSKTMLFNNNDENALDKLEGKEILDTLIRILNTKKACELFEKEHRDLYFYLYLSDPQKKIPNFKEIAEMLDLNRKTVIKIIKPIRAFLKEEIRKLNESGEIDKFLIKKQK